MTRSPLRRAAVVAATAGALLVAIAAPAAAHVTVNPNSATQGGFTKVSFRVPNEMDRANTTKLEVTIPTDTPVAFVSLKPVTGWTAKTEKTVLKTPIKAEGGEITEAISKITWTAAGDAAIKPGQFQEFDVSLGPLPETDQMIFKALQTYSDGTVVRWIDEPAVGGAEPDTPGARTQAGSGRRHRWDRSGRRAGRHHRGRHRRGRQGRRQRHPVGDRRDGARADRPAARAARLPPRRPVGAGRRGTARGGAGVGVGRQVPLTGRSGRRRIRLMRRLRRSRTTVAAWARVRVAARSPAPRGAGTR
jgi:uncharacterized protein YcnI